VLSREARSTFKDLYILSYTNICTKQTYEIIKHVSIFVCFVHTQGDCCLAQIQQFRHLYHGENKLFVNEIMMKFTLF
jgi:hypothetical protein